MFSRTVCGFLQTGRDSIEYGAARVGSWPGNFILKLINLQEIVD